MGQEPKTRGRGRRRKGREGREGRTNEALELVPDGNELASHRVKGNLAVALDVLDEGEQGRDGVLGDEVEGGESGDALDEGAEDVLGQEEDELTDGHGSSELGGGRGVVPDVVDDASSTLELDLDLLLGDEEFLGDVLGLSGGGAGEARGEGGKGGRSQR